MDLNTYIQIMGRRKWVILLTVFSATLVASLGPLITAPTYTAQSQLQVSARRRGSASYGDVLQAERMMKTYVEVATSAAVRQELVRVLEIDDEPEINAEILADTELIELTVHHRDPNVAAQVNNMVAEILVTQSRRLREFRTYPVSVIVPASVPETASKLDWSLTLLLGIIAGAVGGVGLAFLIENLDTTLHSPGQIEELVHLKSLAELPVNSSKQPIVFVNGSSHFSEAYRTLRTNLQGFSSYRQNQVLMVTSAQLGEGTSTTAVNLAIAMAQTKPKVLLVDCNLRNPSVHQILGMPNQIGLSSALIEGYPSAEVLKRSIRYGMQVITSGPVVRSPVELLASAKMREFLISLREQFDFLILDAPAVLHVTDALTLAPMVDGVALVVGANMVNAQALITARNRLNAMNANLIGVVVNRSEHPYIQ